MNYQNILEKFISVAKEQGFELSPEHQICFENDEWIALLKAFNNSIIYDKQ